MATNTVAQLRQDSIVVVRAEHCNYCTNTTTTVTAELVARVRVEKQTNYSMYRRG